MLIAAGRDLGAVLDFETAIVWSVDGVDSLLHSGDSPDVHNVGTSRGAFVLDFESDIVHQARHHDSHPSANVQCRPITLSASDAPPVASNSMYLPLRLAYYWCILFCCARYLRSFAVVLLYVSQHLVHVVLTLKDQNVALLLHLARRYVVVLHLLEVSFTKQTF